MKRMPHEIWSFISGQLMQCPFCTRIALCISFSKFLNVFRDGVKSKEIMLSLIDAITTVMDEHREQDVRLLS